jgi:acyl-CoA dehydrogenase
VFCSEGAFDVCDRAVQLHGALGFIEPVGIARLLRDCRVTRIFEGANDVLLVRLGMSLAMTQEPERAMDPWSADRLEPELRDLARACDSLRARIGIAAATARDAHGVRVVQKQMVLQHLARAQICVRVAECTLMRAAFEGVEKSKVFLLARAAASVLVTEGEKQLDAMRAAIRQQSECELLGQWLCHSNEPRMEPTCSVEVSP